MRARAIVAVLAAGTLAAATQASALERLHTVHFKTSGSLKVVWHGDPARGCAQAGLCRYSGSIAYPPRPKAFIEWVGRATNGEATGFLDMTGPSRVRVRREVPGGPPATCRDRSRFAAFTFDISRAYGHRVWLGLGTRIFPGPIVSGQCAGPLIGDVAPSLPSALIRLRHVAHRGARVSLAGRFPFHRGPLSGEVVSTLRMRSRGARKESPGQRFYPEHADRHRRLYVSVEYRVERAQGEVRSDFRAIDAPICRVRDACGTHGSDVYSLAQEGGSVELFGSMRTGARHAPPLRRAIRMVARHGGLRGFGDVGRTSGLTTNVFVGPGRPRCTFRRRSAPTYVVLGAQRRVTAELYANDTVLDGRCPGPTQDEAIRERVAVGHFGVGRLARRSLELVMHADRGFTAGAFRGTHTAHVELRLRRARARARVLRRGRDGSLEGARSSARIAP
jgi:hypothetical protein